MLKAVIENSPDFIKVPAKSIYQSMPDILRYGNLYRSTYSLLQKSQWWSKEEHERYQLKELQKLVHYAYDNVPYYTDIFNKNKVKPSDIKCFEDIRRIPVLTKDIIINNTDKLLSKKYDKKYVYHQTTGGSTGVPVGFYQNPEVEEPLEWAFITNLFSRVGYNIKKSQKSVILRGNIIVNGFCERKGRELILSSYNLTSENIKKYIELIQSFNPDFIQAYPSTIIILARFITDNGLCINITNLKAIICASENLYHLQKQEIERAFNVRVYSFYGHTEHACLAGECEESNYYHIQSEYGYTEILDSDGRSVVDEDQTGEIVCTGFINYVFPFIRYRTEDIAVNTNQVCSCGRNYKLIKKIHGRIQEYLIDSTGSRITFTCSDEVLWNVKEKIFAYQYIQEKPGRVTLFVQPKSLLKDSDFVDMIQRFEEIYPRIEVEIKLTKNISRTKRGKFKYLVQKIEAAKCVRENG